MPQRHMFKVSTAHFKAIPLRSLQQCMPPGTQGSTIGDQYAQASTTEVNSCKAHRSSSLPTFDVTDSQLIIDPFIQDTATDTSTQATDSEIQRTTRTDKRDGIKKQFSIPIHANQFECLSPYSNFDEVSAEADRDSSTSSKFTTPRYPARWPTVQNLPEFVNKHCDAMPKVKAKLTKINFKPEPASFLTSSGDEGKPPDV